MGSHVSFFSCTHAYDFHSLAAVSSCLNRDSGHAEPPSFDLDTYHPLPGTYHLRIYGRKADKFGEDRSIPLRLLPGPGCAARFHHFSQIHQALRIHTQPGCWKQQQVVLAHDLLPLGGFWDRERSKTRRTQPFSGARVFGHMRCEMGQKANRSANCITRGSPARLVILPKLPEFTLFVGSPKYAVFRRLKVSQRNSRLRPSAK